MCGDPDINLTKKRYQVYHTAFPGISSHLSYNLCLTFLSSACVKVTHQASYRRLFMQTGNCICILKDWVILLIVYLISHKIFIEGA